MTTTTLAIVADLHVNSTVGLCTPVVNLDDGGTYHASPSQRWLHSCWLDFCEKVKASPGRKVAIINGDLGELDIKRRSYQLVSPNKATIVSLVLDVLSPLIEVVDQVYVMRGTAAHTGKSSWLEEAIAQDIITAVHSPEAASWWHIRAKVEDVRLDVAHHASMGGLPWTAKNAANKLAAETIFTYAEEYQQPAPHLVIRSHNHRKADSYNNFSVRTIFTPAWCLPTENEMRNGKYNQRADNGGTLITCQDGQYTYNGPVMYKPAESKRLWRLKM